jgi:hypothetical protein
MFVTLSDRKRGRRVQAVNPSDAIQQAVGNRFFSCRSSSYYMQPSGMRQSFYEVLVKDPQGVISYERGKRIIRLKTIHAIVLQPT